MSKRKVLRLKTSIEKPDSGVIIFNDNFPGVYFQGKHAFYYASAIETLLNAIEPNDNLLMVVNTVKGLSVSLQSCVISNLMEEGFSYDKTTFDVHPAEKILKELMINIEKMSEQEIESFKESKVFKKVKKYVEKQ